MRPRPCTLPPPPYKPLHGVASHCLLLLKNLLHFHRVIISSQHAPFYNIWLIYGDTSSPGHMVRIWAPAMTVLSCSFYLWLGRFSTRSSVLPKKEQVKKSSFFFLGASLNSWAHPLKGTEPLTADTALLISWRKGLLRTTHPPPLPSVLLRLGGVDSRKVGRLRCCRFWREASDTDC